MFYHEYFTPAQLPPDLFDLFLSLGWYPMGQGIFTTSHLDTGGEEPERVHWVRYPVAQVTERRSHRRILRRNAAFSVELLDPFQHRRELDLLYANYFSSIDFDGYESIQDATCDYGETNIYHGKAWVVRDGNIPVSCGIFYTGINSAASILHFFHPGYRRFSPGKYLILLTLDYCRKHGLEWYYPGYIIENNPRMDYKLFLGEEHVQYFIPQGGPVAGSWAGEDGLLNVDFSLKPTL